MWTEFMDMSSGGSENPKKYCSKCKREVYQTVHRPDSYRIDWYTRNYKVICIECYKWTAIKKEK